MRTAFKNDPTIDLLSFIILRTPTNFINVPLQEQSLIPFPVETLFTNELKNFDLVIFDNFFYRPYLNPKHLESIKEFVRRGGGFAVIGGPNFFGEGGYVDMPIEKILPVKFSEKEDYRRDFASGVKLSRLGAAHPFTRFLSNGDNHQSLWKEMPALGGINLLEAKSSGAVLLESSDENPRPILTEGVKERPYQPGVLFEGLATAEEMERVREVEGAFADLALKLLPALAASQRICPCPRLLERYRRRGDLGEDWRTWFK